jgi:hypothetical protein
MSTIIAHPLIFSVPFLLFVVGVGLLLVWIAEKSPAAPLLKSCAGVVAPYSSLLALLFGLFAAFMANDVYVHAERARTSVTREAEAIRLVLHIADALGERGRVLRRSVVDYGKASTGDDWRSASRIAEAEVLSLSVLREIMFGGLATADPQVRNIAANSIMEIRAVRRDRIAVANSKTGELKWIGAFILGVLVQMAVVVVHLGKPRAMVLAVTLFAVGMAFALWVVLVRLDPFVGRNPVSLAPIKAAYQHPP